MRAGVGLLGGHGEALEWTRGSGEPLGCWGRDGRGRPGLDSCVFPWLLCELGEVTLPLWASVSAPENESNITYFVALL